MFSVVIPLYNKEHNIKNTILSILKQSYQNFEIIVINDGSTDKSARVVNKLGDERIRFISQENQGVSAARNKGIQEAKYEWIAFLDGDDVWEPHHLEEIVKMMKLFPQEKVYTTSFNYSDSRKVFRYKRNYPIFKIENYFKEALKEQLICSSTVVVNIQCFIDTGYFNINLSRGEDLDMWFRLAKNFNIIKSSKITAIYNMDDNFSLTKSKSIYEKSFLSIIDLKGAYGFERVYLKKLLIKRIKLDLRTLDIKGLIRILIKHNFELFK